LSTPEPIEGEIVNQMQAVKLPPGIPEMPSVFAVLDPELFLERMKDGAKALVAVVRAKGLIIKGLNRKSPEEEFMEFEGWQMLGAMFQSYPATEWTRAMRHPTSGKIEAWEARVIVKHFDKDARDGVQIGAAESMCEHGESKQWTGSPNYAVRSMAQTRTASKALRQCFSFILTLEGVKATPADEMRGIYDIHPARPSEPDLPPTPAATPKVKPATAQERAQAARTRNGYVARCKQLAAQLEYSHEELKSCLFYRYNDAAGKGIEKIENLSDAQIVDFGKYLRAMVDDAEHMRNKTGPYASLRDVDDTTNVNA
jgi:hypothetical protein